MTDAERIQKCEQFKQKYEQRRHFSHYLTTERICILNNLAKLHELAQADMIPRANSSPPVKVMPDEAAEIINILHVEAESNRRVCVIQLFGANTGHVAANAALASGDVDAVLIPEEDYEVGLVCEHIKQRVTDKGHAVVVMAEGARGAENRRGKWVRWGANTREERDSRFWMMQEAIRNALKADGLGRYQVFGNQPQHVIRSVVPNSHDQVCCRRLADMVVDACLAGYTNFMISSWLTEYVLIPLIFPAAGGLTQAGCKTFPTGGVFWRTVVRNTGQPTFISDDLRNAIRAGQVQ